jgi:hypothetical protein
VSCKQLGSGSGGGAIWLLAKLSSRVFVAAVSSSPLGLHEIRIRVERKKLA